MIRFNNVTKRYPSGVIALNHLSFHITKGEMVFLTGHSGAGKSTVLKLISLQEQCNQGHILIGGKNLSRLKNKHIPLYRRNVGMIAQSPQLLNYRTVFENVALPLIIEGFRHQEIGRRVRAALDKVGLLHKEKNFPHTLSAGEQQRVGIARAVVNRPTLLLADEPTGNLDPELSLETMHLFRQFSEIGTTVLIATHDLPLIAAMKHRMLTLKHGQLCQKIDAQEGLNS
jgi:cell division transport system ATP-binding protein